MQMPMTSRPFLSIPALAFLLATATFQGCTSTSGDSSREDSRTRKSTDRVSKATKSSANEATDETSLLNQRTLEAMEQASALKEQSSASSERHPEMVERGDKSFAQAESARFNSQMRAARELYLEASEFYSLALEISGEASTTSDSSRVEDEGVASVRPAGDGNASNRPVEIPAYAPVNEASPASVAALFAEVDRAQRQAYTGGGLRVAPELIKEADAELWDAQIADAKDDHASAAGHLKRIHAIYSEAYRRARTSGSDSMTAASTSEGANLPIRWFDSFTQARARAGAENRPILLLLYDRVSPEVVGLFSDPRVREKVAGVFACKHRVTEVLSGVDEEFLTENDREVGKIIRVFSIRTFPALLLLDSKGDTIDSTDDLRDTTAILELLSGIE